MDGSGPLNLKSLKEQVYDYLRHQMERGELRPNMVINTEETSRRLGVSKTPLRDALVQLESEGFVSILPRRGVVVNPLTLDDIRNSYEIIGALESSALLSAFERLGPEAVTRLVDLNAGMAEAISLNRFDLYYEKNLGFHNIFLELSPNSPLVKIVTNLKRRLYDFPRQEGFVKDWELASIEEHRTLADFIERGEAENAARYIRDVHWSFKVQERFIRKYYRQAEAVTGGRQG